MLRVQFDGSTVGLECALRIRAFQLAPEPVPAVRIALLRSTPASYQLESYSLRPHRLEIELELSGFRIPAPFVIAGDDSFGLGSQADAPQGTLFRELFFQFCPG